MKKIVFCLIVFSSFLIITGCSKEKNLVQQTCDTYGDYEAVRENKVSKPIGDGWYCCPIDEDKNTCIYFGEL